MLSLQGVKQLQSDYLFFAFTELVHAFARTLPEWSLDVKEHAISFIRGYKKAFLCFVRTKCVRVMSASTPVSSWAILSFVYSTTNNRADFIKWLESLRTHEREKDFFPVSSSLLKPSLTFQHLPRFTQFLARKNLKTPGKTDVFFQNFREVRIS